MISAIVAVDANYGIGSKGKLLTHIPEDMKMFKKLTTNNIVVMGRKTYESLPKKPLPNRTNIIVTSQPSNYPEFDINNINNKVVACDMDDITWVLNSIKKNKSLKNEDDDIYIIGGGQIYKKLLPFCERVYITKVFHAYNNVDTYFPNIDEMSEWKMTSASEVKEYNGIKYQFCIYDKF